MAEYIEREALLAAYNKAHVGPPGGARKLIEEAPTADVVPVVHGRWMEVPYVYIGLKRYECSNCYSDVFWNERIQYHKDKYCPNCGARMKGGGSDEG